MPLTKVSTLLGFALDWPPSRPTAITGRLLGYAVPGRYDAQGIFDAFSPANTNGTACEMPFCLRGYGWSRPALPHWAPRPILRRASCPSIRNRACRGRRLASSGGLIRRSLTGCAASSSVCPLSSRSFLAHEPTSGDLLVAQLQDQILDLSKSSRRRPCRHISRRRRGHLQPGL